jgi:hypothetical protein
LLFRWVYSKPPSGGRVLGLVIFFTIKRLVTFFLTVLPNSQLTPIFSYSFILILFLFLNFLFIIIFGFSFSYF